MTSQCVPAILVLVSHEGHCLNDLLYRWRTGSIAADIVGIASPYADFAELAGDLWRALAHGSLGPAPPGGARRARCSTSWTGTPSDLVVLARFMQVLGRDACHALAGRAINIHHSFLPSFKGAEPYRQAHERGVKLIGATAHYVTEELDEGPIIEQEVARWTTPTGSPSSRASGVTSSASPWRARCAGTSSTGCCSTVSRTVVFR